MMGGRTPMIIELKTGRRNDELCEKGLALMRAYNGPYCIESFDPRIVRWFRKNAKDVLRGQLSDAPASFPNFARSTLANRSLIVRETGLHTDFRPRFRILAENHGLGAKSMSPLQPKA